MQFTRSFILIFMFSPMIIAATKNSKQIVPVENQITTSPYYLSESDSLLYNEPLSMFDLKRGNVLGTINEEEDTLSILDPFFHIRVHEWNLALKTITALEEEDFIKRQKYIPSLIELRGILSLYLNIKYSRGHAFPRKYSELQSHVEACLRATQSLKKITKYSGLTVRYSTGQVSRIGEILYHLQWRQGY